MASRESSNPKPCKDCPTGSKRPLVEGSGGRCATHWREEKNRRKDRRHEQHVQKTYDLSEGEYEALYVWQGGRCAICQHATGKTRRLSVDHDHKTGLVRGLLCRPCNTVLGRAGDNPAWFDRGALYLRQPPYERFRNGG